MANGKDASISGLVTSSGWPIRRRLKKYAARIPAIRKAEEACRELTDHQLRKQSLALRYRARSGEPLDRLLPEAYGLVCEVGHRKLSMRPFDVQLIGGMAMHHGSVVEMQTGEGKTLAATLPLYLNALTGRGTQLATVNDYLARRDAEWMGPIYTTLGLSVGVVESMMPQPARRQGYACDITYGTAKEFGFDFLRDRLLLRRRREGLVDVLGGMMGKGEQGGGEDPVQRDAHFALVDEADSILIDEARTPLIISAAPTEAQRIAVECYKWAAGLADRFAEDTDYEYDHEKRTVELTAVGRRLVRELQKPEAMDSVGMFDIYDYIERCVRVERDFSRDREYVVSNGEIVIVDEFTGRLAEGRKWRDGLHQAVEARENVEVTVETGQAARITIQDFFLRFERLCGMTGTAAASARELRKIYKVYVDRIPTNRPSGRQPLPTQVYGTADQRWSAIVDEVAQLHAEGRPVLVGTRSIDKSEVLSRLLEEREIEHVVLNANHLEAEAGIVEAAGQQGKVTVATNMAGRGTDIKLGEGVPELGGLHVIASELHDAARVDQQLIGRCGRQGDPGTYRQYAALDDDILSAGLGPKKARRLTDQGSQGAGNFDRLAALHRKAQRIIERRHFRQRRVLMYFEKERKKMQQQMGQDPYLDTAE